MDLSSGYPFWAVKNGLMHAFPPLRQDLRCEVAVIGGGITGALIADELARNQHEVAVFEQRDVGWGSTAASTALLQYEIDVHLVDLAKRYGESDAVLAYQAGAAAIVSLRALADELGDVDFDLMDSLYYASKERHAGSLREEHALRKRHGFAVELLEPKDVEERFKIAAPVAILSHQAARIDPYRMAYRLLTRLERAGTSVFDRCSIERIHAGDTGITLLTADGQTVRAEHVVLAAGYANQRWLKQRLAKNRSSYAYVTDPIDDTALGALKTTMVWESARPYLYMRATGDGRLLVGGEDDAIDIPLKRDLRVNRKAAILCERVEALLPHLTATPVFAWAGTFAETDDGLPFFGPHEELGPRVHFASAFGGNGITYAMIGAGLLRARIERRPHPLAEFFSFTRLKG